MHFLVRILRYVWASPATALGLLFVAMTWASGGSVCVQTGTVEAHGGLARRVLRRGLPLLGSGAAITFGHVILGQDSDCLEDSREHEHVHVRQYERWGPFMLPLYVTASLILWLRHRDPYLDNPFEIEAYDRRG